MLCAAGATVEGQTNTKGSTQTRKKLQDGVIDVVWEYTGTGWITYLGHDKPILDPQKQYEAVKKEDLAKNELLWGPMAPFNNTYAFAVTDEFGEKNSLKTQLRHGGLHQEEPVGHGVRRVGVRRPSRRLPRLQEEVRLSPAASSRASAPASSTPSWTRATATSARSSRPTAGSRPSACGARGRQAVPPALQRRGRDPGGLRQGAPRDARGARARCAKVLTTETMTEPQQAEERRRRDGRQDRDGLPEEGRLHQVARARLMHRRGPGDRAHPGLVSVPSGRSVSSSVPCAASSLLPGCSTRRTPTWSRWRGPGRACTTRPAAPTCRCSACAPGGRPAARRRWSRPSLPTGPVRSRDGALPSDAASWRVTRWWTPPRPRGLAPPRPRWTARGRAPHRRAAPGRAGRPRARADARPGTTCWPARWWRRTPPATPGWPAGEPAPWRRSPPVARRPCRAACCTHALDGWATPELADFVTAACAGDAGPDAGAGCWPSGTPPGAALAAGALHVLEPTDAVEGAA